MFFWWGGYNSRAVIASERKVYIVHQIRSKYSYCVDLTARNMAYSIFLQH